MLDAVNAIYAATGEAAHVAQVAEYTDTTKQNASKHLLKLTEEALLSNIDRGAYLPEPVDTADAVDTQGPKSTQSTTSTTSHREVGHA